MGYSVQGGTKNLPNRALLAMGVLMSTLYQSGSSLRGHLSGAEVGLEIGVKLGQNDEIT